MKRLGEVLKGTRGVLLLAGLAVVLSLTVCRLAREKSASSPTSSPQAVQEGPVATMAAQSPLPTPSEGPTSMPPLTPTEDTTSRSPLPTPSEEPAPLLPPTPTPIEPAPLPPETPPLPAGKAVTLHYGDVWLVEPDREPRPLTDCGDASAIFGWNKDGTMLLFGRGRIVRPHLVGDTTELWLLAPSTLQTRQLTTTSIAKTASWSPVDDRIAYCELGDALTVIARSGEKLHQLEHAICSFAWSPDGSAISLPIYTSDMIDADGLKYTVLGVWWLEDDRLQAFSDAKNEAHGWPVWSTDGERILFLRDYYEYREQELSGMYVADVASGWTQRLEGTSTSAEEMSRSPRADRVVYRLGSDIFVMDFEGRLEIMGHGRSLMWLADGRTLLYRAVDGTLQVVAVDLEVGKSAAGGQRPTTGLYIQPEYSFAPGG